MKDLTNNPFGGHILQMAAPIAAGMFFQTVAGSRRVSQPAGNFRFGAAGIGLRSRN
jgi:hypothetical protein